MNTEFVPDSDLLISWGFENFMPSVAVELRTSRPLSVRQDTSRGALHRIAAAFFLEGFDIASTGTVATFDLPRWANYWMHHEPIPVYERHVTAPREITDQEFKNVVDLALAIPEFGADEATSQSIVMNRLLRGCGTQQNESAFLDFAIALEAALLGGTRTELAYRFKLYGSLFLRDNRDPSQTFSDFAKVYRVRSDLVHGTPVTLEKRVEATNLAKELALAVVRKSVRDAWPDSDALDALALGDREH